MRQLTMLSLLTLALMVGLVFAGQPGKARALDRGILTSEHIEVIKHNCHQAQTIMTRLHKSDQLLRVNQGQIYESISSKLMAPFNARAGLNKYETTELVTITGEFNNHFAEYRTLYKEYDAALQKAIRVDCNNQPVGFYDYVSGARDKRAEVHDKSTELVESIDSYYAAFKDLIDRGPTE